MPDKLTIPHRTFYFVRHGETAWNTQHLGQGHSDVPLNEQGQKQAERAAEMLFLQKAQIDTIISSPLGRALDTAKSIGRRINKSVHVLDDLKEAYLGKLEGAVMPTVDVFLARWRQEGVTEGGEDFNEAKKRVTRAMQHILSSSSGTPLIVSHGLFYILLNEVMSFSFFFPDNAQPMLHVPIVTNNEKTIWLRSALALSGDVSS